MVNFENAKIYKIVDNTNGNIYIGSTCEPTLARRLAKHKCDYNRYLTDKSKHYTTSFEILKHDDYDIVLVEKCDNITCKDELTSRERFYIESMECVNKRIEGRTNKEYREEHKEKFTQYFKDYKQQHKEHYKELDKNYRDTHKDEIRLYKKNYRLEHKEEIAEKDKAYREANKDRLKEQKKQYNELNRDILNAKKREYYEKHKAEIRQKQNEHTTCPHCNLEFRKTYLSKHITIKH
jgi:hypothetical protein